MGETPMPNYWGRLLIRELIRLRMESGMTQEQVGHKGKFGMQKVSRFETGQVPSWHELLMLIDLYGVPSSDTAYYEDLWDKA